MNHLPSTIDDDTF